MEPPLFPSPPGEGGGFAYTCSNRLMGVRLPDWWQYPAACEQGHPWGPGRVIVSWMHCHCGPAVAAAGGRGPPGHLAVFCNASPGCRSVWFRPSCERS